jgi:chorismate mutase
MFQQLPEAAPQPEQAPPPSEGGEEQLIQNPDVTEVEAYAEDMHRDFMATFGQEQADEWMKEQRPVLDNQIKEIEAVDKASDLMVLLITQNFMRSIAEARKSGAEKPVTVFDSEQVTSMIEATKASPGYGVAGNTGPLVENAIDKFTQILTGEKLSKIRDALVDWHRSPKFEKAPRGGQITPSLTPLVIEKSYDEVIRTNLSNIALTINPDSGAFQFVYIKNIPRGVPTATQFIQNCNMASGKEPDFIIKL